MTASNPLLLKALLELSAKNLSNFEGLTIPFNSLAIPVLIASISASNTWLSSCLIEAIMLLLAFLPDSSSFTCSASKATAKPLSLTNIES